MTIPELMAALKAQPFIQLASKDHHAPFPRKGWPKGELLCHNSEGGSVWMYKSDALLKALEKNGVKVVE